MNVKVSYEVGMLPPQSSSFDQVRDVFHAHLGACERCRNNPHGMCLLGAALLQRAAEARR